MEPSHAEQEKDLLDILIESTLYFELPLPERHRLILHICDCLSAAEASAQGHENKRQD